MSSIIDTTGYSCPQPMLMVKNILLKTEDDAVTVIADCEASRENISRLAKKMGWTVTVEETEKGLFSMGLKKQG